MTNTISVSTQSQTMGFPVMENDPDNNFLPATVTINATQIRTQIEIAPSHASLIVFDPSLPLDSPSAVLLKKSLWNPANDWENDLWWSTNDQFYDFLHNQILSSGHPDNLLFLLATSGFDAGMVPSPSFATFLFSCGAGQPLQQWISHVPGGSGTNPQQAWVANPANYIFMGATGLGFGEALGEKFETPASGQTSVTSTLTISE